MVTYAKLWSLGALSDLAGMTSDDVLYVTLPLYHTLGFASIAATIHEGTRTVLTSACCN